MSITMTCPLCRLSFASQRILVSDGRLTVKGVKELCPRCGGQATSRDGTYDFVGSALAAFTAPGVSRETIAKLGEIAEQTRQGTLSVEEATSAVQSLGEPLAKLWAAGNTSAGVVAWLGLLITLIQLFLSFVPDEGARSQLAESRKQTVVLQKIQEALESQVEGSVSQPRMTKSLRSRPAKMRIGASGGNRHERRKSAALDRRRPER